MIRYPILESDLLHRITAEAPSWRRRAEDRTDRFQAARAYDEESDIWGEVKPVYMALQHNKCAYCERKLEGPPYGEIEHDMEHFRPKRAVPEWPDDHARDARGIRYAFTTGRAYPRGYYLLAYAPLNYAAACKVCNSPLKASFFPIRGARRRPSRDVREYASEEPLLLYPLGDTDADDPETLITFRGFLPIPRYKSGRKHRRAVVTIDFFELDTREDLLRERAFNIIALHMAREKPNDPTRKNILAALRSPTSPHTSCNRSFYRLCDEDPALARSIYDSAGSYLSSQS